MWLLALIVPLASADEAAYTACCERAGADACPTHLAVIGPGSTTLYGRRATEVQGVWSLSCQDGAAFYPAASRATSTTAGEGDVLTTLSEDALICFSRTCELPTHLCLHTTEGRAVVVSCDLGAPPGLADWQDVRLLPYHERATEPAPVADDPPPPPAFVATAPPVAPGSTKDDWAAPTPAPPAVAVWEEEPAEPALADWEIETAAPATVAPAVVAPAIVAPATVAPAAPPPPPAAPQPTRALTSGDLVLPRLPPDPCVPNPALRQPSVQQVDAGDEASLAGDVSGALGHYRAAITVDSCNPFAWAALGHTLLTAGSPRTAVLALETATRIMPTHHRAWTELGLAREAQQLIPQAIAAYREALAIQDSYVPAREGLQRTLRQD
jgi:hypothetical protein